VQARGHPGRLEVGQPLTQRVSRLLLEHGLLDELRLWVHPLIVGTGSPSDLLFGEVPAIAFNLIDATTLSDGVVVLTYETDRILDRAGARRRTARDLRPGSGG